MVRDLEPGEFVHPFGDAHICSNHSEQVQTQLARTSRALPTMKINPAVSDWFTFDDFSLEGYDTCASCVHRSVSRSAGGPPSISCIFPVQIVREASTATDK